MIDSQLIMLEGLPSTGKTTNSRFIHTQLERNNIETAWFHEVSMPHPVLFFDEVGMTYDEYDKFIKSYPETADILNSIAVFKKSTMGIALPLIQWNYKDKIDENAYQALLKHKVLHFSIEKYKKFALEKWSYFTERILETHNKVYIMDSTIFQFQISTFLLRNRSYEELQDFLSQIEDIIQPLKPCLIYFYRENTEATINYLENDRGSLYLETQRNRYKHQPYYLCRPPVAESVKQFLRDYSDMAGLLFDAFQTSKLSLEISSEDWPSIKDEILSFLGISRKPIPNALSQNGVYKNEEFGFVISVDGLSIIDPTGKARELIPKSENEFYIDLLPAILRFEDNRIIISGSQIRARWTTTGMIYDKVIL